MKRLALPLLFAAMMATAPAAASATTFVLSPVQGSDGSWTLAFSHQGVQGEGFENAKEFEDIFEFTLPVAGKLFASITTVANTAPSERERKEDPLDPSNINFGFVTLNFTPFVLDAPGQLEDSSLLNVPGAPGVQRLVVHGFSGGNGGYGGNITFAPNPIGGGGGEGGAVPEPASWALMILGFGGAGAALRRRRVGAFSL